MGKKIELNGKSYTIPTKWEDITIRDIIRVSDIQKKYTGVTSHIQLIAGYANIPVEDIKKVNINKLPELLKNLEFVKEPVSQDPITEFEHKGHKYYILNTLMKGEFQDFISLESVQYMFKDNPVEGLPMMIAILAKREGETLDSYDIEERSKEFYDLPYDIANRISVFFYQTEMLSRINSPLFLEKYEKMTEKEVIRRFEELENTMNKSDGQGWLSRLRTKILRKYVKSLKKNYLSSLDGIPQKS